ncbi:hypothetical protein GGI35DRAFT_187436 [Trichoderma velutinum]
MAVSRWAPPRQGPKTNPRHFERIVVLYWTVLRSIRLYLVMIYRALLYTATTLAREIRLFMRRIRDELRHVRSTATECRYRYNSVRTRAHFPLLSPRQLMPAPHLAFLSSTCKIFFFFFFFISPLLATNSSSTFSTVAKFSSASRARRNNLHKRIVGVPIDLN